MSNNPFRNAFAEAVVAEIKMMSERRPDKYSSNFRVLDYEEACKAALKASTAFQEEIRKISQENEEYLEDTLESMQETHATIKTISTAIEEYQANVNTRLAVLENDVPSRWTWLLFFISTSLVYALGFWALKHVCVPNVRFLIA
jgi:hypothetical protein